MEVIMKILETIILGIIQGIAEFLPISSSAHLIIFRDLFGIGSNVIDGDLALIFDIALHFGTLLAIALYFFKDFLNMVIKGITKGPKDKEGKMFYYIIVATIPAAIAGVLFEDVIEEYKDKVISDAEWSKIDSQKSSLKFHDFWKNIFGYELNVVTLWIYSLFW